jgi:uncharacterized protein (TIGR02271 family)
MTRMITAMFDTRAEADAAADHLVRETGLSRSAVQIHGGEAGAGATRAPAAATADDTSFWGALRDLFVPDEDRPTYAEGLRRGSFLVTAEVEDAELERAMDLLESHGAVDLDSREAQWRESGWTGQETVASLPTAPETGVAGTTREKIIERPGGAGGDFTTDPAPGMMDSPPDTSRRSHETGMAIASGASAGATVGGAAMGQSSRAKPGARGTEEVIPVVEERIQIGKRDVERGRVRVRSYIVERPVNEQVTLRSEHVEVERRRVDRPAGASGDLFRERTIEAVERGEEAVVAKEARVTEEVVLKKDATERTETVSDTVRRTEVEVEDETKAKGTLGARHATGTAPDGTPGNPPGTMASRGIDKTLGTNASGANPGRENITDLARNKPSKP